MNLAARFSTSANIGELDLRLTRRSLILGNLALLQVQALIVSLLSGLLAFVLGLASRKGVHHALQNPIHDPASAVNAAAGGLDATAALRGGYFEALLVLCVSMLAAGISSGVLGSFMCSLVVLCRRFHVNPGALSPRARSDPVLLERPRLTPARPPHRQHRYACRICTRRHGDARHPRRALEPLHPLHGSVQSLSSTSSRTQSSPRAHSPQARSSRRSSSSRSWASSPSTSSSRSATPTSRSCSRSAGARSLRPWPSRGASPCPLAVSSPRATSC